MKHRGAHGRIVDVPNDLVVASLEHDSLGGDAVFRESLERGSRLLHDPRPIAADGAANPVDVPVAGPLDLDGRPGCDEAQARQVVGQSRIVQAELLAQGAAPSRQKNLKSAQLRSIIP